MGDMNNYRPISLIMGFSKDLTNGNAQQIKSAFTGK